MEINLESRVACRHNKEFDFDSKCSRRYLSKRVMAVEKLADWLSRDTSRRLLEWSCVMAVDMDMGKSWCALGH